jgi:hypothetical protein
MGEALNLAIVPHAARRREERLPLMHEKPRARVVVAVVDDEVARARRRERHREASRRSYAKRRSSPDADGREYP